MPATIHARCTVLPCTARTPRAATAQPVSVPELAAGATHLPVVSQTDGATQSATEVHCVRHVPLLSHRYGVQSCVLLSAPVVVWSPSQVAPETHF